MVMMTVMMMTLTVVMVMMIGMLVSATVYSHTLYILV